MSNITIRQLFSFPKNQPIQMFVSGSTFSAVADFSVDIRQYTIPTAPSVEGIKFYQLQDIINGYVNLKQNWDSYNANAISVVAVETALEVLHQLNKDDVFSAGIEINVFPMRDGGIQFEFDAKNLCAELEISSQGQMIYILFDENANIVQRESVFSYELHELSILLSDGIYA